MTSKLDKRSADTTPFIDLETVSHHPTVEEISDILAAMTSNENHSFFRTVSLYFLAKMASSMWARVSAPIFPEPLVTNVYVIAMAESGFGKGYSTNILENQLLGGFRRRFKEDTFPTLADQALWDLAMDRSVISGDPEDKEREKLDISFRKKGAIPFNFDSGTIEGIKQVRQKILMARSGSVNFMIDELGSNLQKATDVFNIFLELFDAGRVQEKLVKSSADNEREESIDGSTGANMLAFGTPKKIMDGAYTESLFYEMLETGYARRCMFAWGEIQKDRKILTPAERLQKLSTQSSSQTTKHLTQHFRNLADPAKYGWTVEMDKDVMMLFLEYQHACELAADQLKEHEDIRRYELSHRHSKAVRIAGVLAFIDESLTMTKSHMLQAIKLVEESAEAFERLLHPEEPYVKLAKFLGESDHPVTGAKLMELPFYKQCLGGDRGRAEMLRYAAAWGYENNVIIRKTYEDGIEFFEGETLDDTDPTKLILSHSTHPAFHFGVEAAPLEHIDQLLTQPAMHWINHATDGGHRLETKIIPGFNMLVFDVDGTATLDFVHEELQAYTFVTQTTKRHDPDGEHRFRLLMPISHVLKLNQEDYDTLVENVMTWLPFEADQSSRQRSKKWTTYENAEVHYNEGTLLNILPFIPRTSKNESFKESMEPLQSLDHLERWFANQFQSGNRNNLMHRYARALVDDGRSLGEIESRLLNFNQQVPNGLDEDEIRGSILKTAARKIAERA